MTPLVAVRCEQQAACRLPHRSELQVHTDRRPAYRFVGLFNFGRTFVNGMRASSPQRGGIFIKIAERVDMTNPNRTALPTSSPTAYLRINLGRHPAGLASRDVSPRQEIVDLAIGMAVDDSGEDVSEVAQRLTLFSLQLSTSDATVAQCSAPPSEPAKSAFLRFRRFGRIERSTVLESISMRPSSRKSESPSHRESV